MAMVLKFPLERVARTGKSQIQNGEAKIIVFEGVRYISDEESPKSLAKADKR